MKKLLKAVCIVLTLVLVLSAFTSCSKKEASTKNGEPLTYWSDLYITAAETLTSYNDMLMYQEMCKATGIDVEFIHPTKGASATGSENFQIMLASSELPDMIEYYWATYAGGPDKAISDGVIISLNKYLEEYAPNYYDYMEGERSKIGGGLYKRQSISSNGNYYGFKTLNSGNVRNFGGLYIRKDVLDKWGLDIPETIDDWDIVFETAKKNGFDRPLSVHQNVLNVSAGQVNTFNGAWGVGQQFYIDGDTVKFGPFEPEYKDYVAKLAEWYKKGYIDPDFITNENNEIFAGIISGKSIASFGFISSSLGVLLPAIEERYGDSFELAACPYPVLKRGDKSKFSNPGAESQDPTLAISVQCGKEDEQRYKDAIKWCDYLYSEEGTILKNYGVEGYTYEIKTIDGVKHYEYTDVIKDHEKIGAHSVEAARFHFFRAGNAPGLAMHPVTYENYYPYKAQNDAIGVWNDNIDEQRHSMWYSSSISFSEKDAETIANAQAVASKDFAADMLNIIIGKKPVDDWDDVVAKVKKNGYGEILKIYQKAYDQYSKYE